MAAELHAVEAGTGRQTVVLLHGFGFDHALWERLQAGLAPHARILAYDLPGHGDSLDYPGAGPARLAARAVLDDLAARTIPRAHVVGHSMGGTVAALMALSEPSRVASLCLAAPGGFGVQINSRLLARFAAAERPEDIRCALEGMYGWTYPVPEATVERLARQRARPGQTAGLVATAEAMAGGGRQGVIKREKLAELTMPVRLLWGTQDNVVPASQSQGMPPGFALHLLADLGHMLPDEAVDVLERLMRHTLCADIFP